jgi:hypothetical protein
MGKHLAILPTQPNCRIFGRSGFRERALGRRISPEVKCCGFPITCPLIRPSNQSLTKSPKYANMLAL